MFTSIMLLDYLKLTTKIWILNLKKPIIFICLTQYTYVYLNFTKFTTNWKEYTGSVLKDPLLGLIG